MIIKVPSVKLSSSNDKQIVIDGEEVEHVERIHDPWKYSSKKRYKFYKAFMTRVSEGILPTDKGHLEIRSQ